MRITIVLCCLLVLTVGGCGVLRFEPNEAQKQNARLHQRTAELAARRAEAEQTSDTLQGLCSLGERQSRAFSAYFGMPKEPPTAFTADEILAEENFTLADTAYEQSLERPDLWGLADGLLELSIAAAAVLGGAWSVKFADFLSKVRQKSNALREIIEANEIFKKQNAKAAEAFRKAQTIQSAQTRKVVAEIKNSG